MKLDIKKLINEMTFEEKASLCSGLDFWNTKMIERLGIPSIMMTDGPHGLRKPISGGPSHGIGYSAPSTCFPTGPALAATWDMELIEQVGIAIGKAAQTEGVHMVLGPAINIKRSPLCGRNFEYYSEDPYLTAELAASFINGVQSQGVGTSVKHYAVHNQEQRRMSVDAVVDERTLREIYLPGFEGAVKDAQPWTIMAAYNKVNGTFATENPYLLTDVLRKDWGFEGVVISDWMAVNERAHALAAGLDLEMPGNGGYGDQKIVNAVQKGELSIEQVDEAVERILSLISKAMDNRNDRVSCDKEEHHQLARRVAAEGMVLLKNEAVLLPLKKTGRVAVIGEMAKNPRYQGGGSSHMIPTKIDVPWDELVAGAAGQIEWIYAQGYELERDEWNEDLANEAIRSAQHANCAIVFAGLPELYESEGFDREHMRMPGHHNRLIEEVAKVQPNLIVVLSNGSPVEMPWIGQAKAVLEAYLGGQAAGSAIADILLGEANPCGKLAETFPQQLEHNPSYFNFPGEGDEVAYREGLLIGYRYYDTKKVKPLFAFGHGLSYTTFKYSGMTLDKTLLTDQESFKVVVSVKNTGQIAGKEIVQLYVRDVKSSVARPEKELKGFSKIHLEPGEEKDIEFVLNKRAFAYYNTTLKDWHVESGEFEILAGTSSDNILLTATVQVDSTAALPKRFTRNSTIGDLMQDPVGSTIVQQIMQGIGQSQGESENKESTDSETTNKMMAEIVKSMPLRSLVVTSKGAFDDQKLAYVLGQVGKSNPNVG